MSRRGNNEGSIYQRPDGRCVAQVHVGYKAGKRVRKYIYGTTRREVAKRLAVVQRELQAGVAPASDRETVARFLDHWLAETVRTTLWPRTFRGYSDIVRLHLVPEIGRVPLAKLSPQHVLMLQNHLLEAGKSVSTVRNVRNVLSGALDRAAKWGLIARNPVPLVDAPRMVHSEVRPLTPEQARLLLDSVRGDRLEALYSVALAVGLRLGEALGLHWEDVDLEVGTLRVRWAVQRVGGALQLVEPKTVRSRRTVPIPKTVVELLRAHRVHQLEERLASGDRWRDSGLVFASTVGTPLEPRNVLRSFQAKLARAGLPRQRFHDLRHACASLLLAQGVNPRVVMETLGNSQISTTMDIYSHVLPVLQRDAADRMGSLLRGVS